ncbi:hypothetical protein GGR56DRAFT_413107 [Xylariaceae sp. FL0804]|nr:hypothetical protein GGR56DRAFT_413107 [Xylariaceae sp. FL0804]
MVTDKPSTEKASRLRTPYDFAGGPGQALKTVSVLCCVSLAYSTGRSHLLICPVDLALLFLLFKQTRAYKLLDRSCCAITTVTAIAVISAVITRVGGTAAGVMISTVVTGDYTANATITATAIAGGKVMVIAPLCCQVSRGAANELAKHGKYG